MGGARLLVEHLIASGHRRIGRITEPQDVPPRETATAGIMRAQGERHTLRSRSGRSQGSGATIAGALSATGELLGRHEAPSAIFAVNNLAAVGVVLAVRAAGLEVPAGYGGRLFRRYRVGLRPVPFSHGNGPTRHRLRHDRHPAPARPHSKEPHPKNASKSSFPAS